MWRGGGELSLGNTFYLVPAFPESQIHFIIVHVLNITWMFSQRVEKVKVTDI